MSKSKKKQSGLAFYVTKQGKLRIFSKNPKRKSNKKKKKRAASAAAASAVTTSARWNPALAMKSLSLKRKRKKKRSF